MYAFRRVLSLGLGAEYRDQFHCLVNAEAYAAGRLADFSAVGVRAVYRFCVVLAFSAVVVAAVLRVRHAAADRFEDLRASEFRDEQAERVPASRRIRCPGVPDTLPRHRNQR